MITETSGVLLVLALGLRSYRARRKRLALAAQVAERLTGVAQAETSFSIAPVFHRPEVAYDRAHPTRALFEAPRLVVRPVEAAIRLRPTPALRRA